MAIKNGAFIRRIGGASQMPIANGAHNFCRDYYKSTASADVRAEYQDLYFNGTGGGEVLRARGIANTTGTAAGATINACHFTGRVASGATVSGALNAIRATLEVAGTTPTPGGTLAALQVDTNISTGWTAPTDSSFIRVTNTGAGLVTNLFSLPAVANGSVIAAHTAQTNTHSIKIISGGTVYYIPCHATASGRS